MNCKHCGGKNYVKNGFQNGKQNYKCKTCQRSFTEGDGRCKDRSQEKALCFLCYSMGKVSMRFLADLLDVSVSTISLWLQAFADSIDPPEIEANIEEIEIDEMWHFIEKKLKNCGSLKPWIVVQSERSLGSPVVVMWQR